MRWFRRLFSIFSDDKITALEKAVDVEYQNAVKLKEATLNNENRWMLEEKKDSVVKRFSCDCKEVAK